MLPTSWRIPATDEFIRYTRTCPALFRNPEQHGRWSPRIEPDAPSPFLALLGICFSALGIIPVRYTTALIITTTATETATTQLFPAAAVAKAHQRSIRRASFLATFVQILHAKTYDAGSSGCSATSPDRRRRCCE